MRRAGGAGKTVHVLTAGNPFTDTAVDILNTAGTSIAVDPLTGQTGGPIDDNQPGQEDVTSTPISAADGLTIFVQIQSGGGFITSQHTYIAGIWLE